MICKAKLVLIILKCNFFSETNLKSKVSLIETADMGQDDGLLGSFDGEIICEPPNNLLNKFDGTMTWRGKR